jgi:energy-coupling factor transporter ATP-binding protein EcfA2
MQPIIAISKLSKTYASGFEALKHVDLDIRRGEILALLGPNGAGKTTLISIVCGIVNASSGTVTADGHDIVRDFRAARIRDLFRVSQNEGSFGSPQTKSLEDGKVVKWNHLYTGDIPKHLRVAAPDAVRGDYRTTVQVFERGLTELATDAVDTVIGLVQANALYRGQEHLPALLPGPCQLPRSLLEIGIDRRKSLDCRALQSHRCSIGRCGFLKIIQSATPFDDGSDSGGGDAGKEAEG